MFYSPIYTTILLSSKLLTLTIRKTLAEASYLARTSSIMIRRPGTVLQWKNEQHTVPVSSRGGVRTDIGLSYALTYFCPDKSSVSGLRPVSSCREAQANCKTGIFPTARCNHDITVCPASLQPISRRTHQLDTPAITVLLCTIPTVLVMRCLYAHILYLYIQ